MIPEGERRDAGVGIVHARQTSITLGAGGIA